MQLSERSTSQHKPSYSIREISDRVARHFMTRESKRLLAVGVEDTQYLNTNEYIFELTVFYGVFWEDLLVGFCVVPKYSPGILMRVYIAPEYRSKGLGAFAIEYLNIVSLSCLRVNKRALALYTSLGFQETGSFSKGIVSMTRTIRSD